jgi:Subtilase family/PA domain/Bacterial pre-peptidase C-terminal domain/Peptidase inhibitor I9
LTRARSRTRAVARGIAVSAVPIVLISALANAAMADDPSSRGGTTAAQVAAPSAGYTDGNYIVVTRDRGATRQPGLRAAGNKFDARTAKVRTFRQQQAAKHGRIAAAVGASVRRHYSLSFSGFAAQLTGDQATKLAASKNVLLVQKDEARKLDTWNTPAMLGLAGQNGLWSKLGGPNNAGDGVVVGIIDSGAWPESKSFAGAPLTSRPQGKWGLRSVNGVTVMKKADGGVFSAPCQTSHTENGKPTPAQEWTAASCNSKLVSARYYPDTFLRQVPPDKRSPTERISARDGGGHGSHTASTAVGNNGVDATVEGRNFGKISGMAPGAKLAVYKVCFDDLDPNTGGCYNSSTLAAIEDAINDGVDVLNFSISGAVDTVVDAVEVAFEGAAEAGIFVAASAGNSGPGASTVAHNSPWLTTVANATHYAFENTVVLGDGTKLKGASVASTAVPSTPLVDARDSGVAGSDPEEAARCFADTLDPAKITGKIVVCTRGVNDRVAKSAEVKRAGGVAVVLVNPTLGSLDADFHSVPTVHLPDTDAAKVFAYAKTAGATASIALGDTTGGAATPVPQIAGSSSRGPALANGSDLLKPDIAAPGTSVLAAVAPDSNHNRDYDLYSGTSMSSPHIAGLAGLILGVNPGWQPSWVKSAMMTTAFDLRSADGTKDTNPFNGGAGFVNPKKFLKPGLVVANGAEDWRGFLAGQGLETGVAPIAAKDFNSPSIADSQVVYRTTLKRTFTGLQKGTWRVNVSVPGFSDKHYSTVKIKRAGDTDEVAVTFTRTNAPLDQWRTGFMTLTGPTTVRLPIAIKAVAVSAPVAVQAASSAGGATINIRSGFTGDLKTTGEGLAEGAVHAENIGPDERKSFEVQVPAGATFARFDLNAGPTDVDLDLFLEKDGQEVASSATGAADERIDLPAPEAGTYTVVVHGYDIGALPTAPFTLSNFVLDPASAKGDFTVPASTPVTQGSSAQIRTTWTGLDATKRYLGRVVFDGGKSTFVEVN